MDSEIQKQEKIDNKPDFERIFRELAKKNLSEQSIDTISSNKEWSSLDVIRINETLFKKTTKENLKFNQKSTNSIILK